MKFTISIPMDINDQKEFQNADAVTEMAQAIEKAGIDACFITDHPAPTAKWRAAGGHDALDPFAGLTFVAAVTRKLRLHTNLVVLPYRNPFLTAKSAATLDVLSEGRLILGVGVGYMRGEYEALGVDFAARGALMDEAILAMREAWKGGPASFEGRNFSAKEVLPQPIPVQRPGPPIWVGGNSEKAMRRAATMCEGWSPFFASGVLSRTTRTDEIAGVADLKEKIQILNDWRAAAGRADQPFDICIGPQRGLSECTTAEADRWVNDVGELAEIGVTWSNCGVPHPTRAAFIEKVQWLGEEVLPRARAAAGAVRAPVA